MNTGSIHFLEIVRGFVIKARRPLSPGKLAKRLDVSPEDVEAAMIHLMSKGEIRWVKRKRKKSS